MVEFKGTLPQEVTSELSSFAYTRENRKSKNLAYIIECPTIEVLRRMVELKANELVPANVNTANLSSFRYWMLTMRVISLFLSTHRYPAFYTRNDQMSYRTELITETKWKKRKTGDNTLVEILQYPSEDNLEDVVEEKRKHKATQARPLDHIHLSYAKPPSSTSYVAYGNASEIPNSDSIFCPYTPALASYDTEMVPDVVQRYFLKCLGSTPAGISDCMDKLRGAWGILGMTDAGKALSHLCAVIDIALRAQCTVFPLFHGHTYEGSLICGSAYSVTIERRVYKPITYEAMQKVLVGAKLHSSILREIRTLVGDADTDETLEKIESYRELNRYLCGKSLDENTKITVKKLVVHLCYKQRFWPITPSTILKALELLMNTEDIPDSVPLHPSCFFSDDRDALVLSAFGYMAPTFTIPNGQKFILQPKAPAPEHFQVRPVALTSAIADFKQVRSSRTLRNNVANASAAHQEKTLKGTDKRDVWASLLKLIGTTATTTLYTVDKVGELEEGKTDILDF